MIFEQRGRERIAIGRGGREYVIGYILGAKRPWYVEGDRHGYPSIDEAEARVHELEAMREDVA